MLEFFTDEVGRSEDALMEMSFFVPRDNDRYGGAGDNPACKVGGHGTQITRPRRLCRSLHPGCRPHDPVHHLCNRMTPCP